MVCEIWKFTLELCADEQQRIDMPKDAAVLDIQVQGSAIAMWALVNLNAARESRCFQIIGTGSAFDGNNKLYRGTVQTPPFVWHIFEVV